MMMNKLTVRLSSLLLLIVLLVASWGPEAVKGAFILYGRRIPGEHASHIDPGHMNSLLVNRDPGKMVSTTKSRRMQSPAGTADVGIQDPVTIAAEPLMVVAGENRIDTILHKQSVQGIRLVLKDLVTPERYVIENKCMTRILVFCQIIRQPLELNRREIFTPTPP